MTITITIVLLIVAGAFVFGIVAAICFVALTGSYFPEQQHRHRRLQTESLTVGRTIRDMDGSIERNHLVNQLNQRLQANSEWRQLLAGGGGQLETKSVDIKRRFLR